MTPRAFIFHYFEDHLHPGCMGSLTAQGFRAALDRIGINRILPARQWLDRAMSGHLAEDDLCLSFDDGLQSQFDVAVPVLRELGLTALWFPYTAPLANEIDRHELFRYFRTLRYPDTVEFYAAFDAAAARSAHAEHIAQSLEGFVAADYLKQYGFYTEADRKFRYLRDKVLGEQAYFEVMEDMLNHSGIDRTGLVGRLWIGAKQWQELHAEGHVIGLHSHVHPLAVIGLSQHEQCQDTARAIDILTKLTGKPICAAYPCNVRTPESMSFMGNIGIAAGFCNTMTEASVERRMELPRQDYNLFAKEPSVES